MWIDVNNWQNLPEMCRIACILLAYLDELRYNTHCESICPKGELH